MAVAQQKQEELPKLETGEGMFNFGGAGWSSKLDELKAEAARIPPCTVSLFSRVRVDDAIASPEALDKQTDMLMRDILPPSELIKTKAIKKAADLSEAEVTGVCDTLLSYFTQFCRGTPANVTVETCFYAHDETFAEGHALGAFITMLLKAMVQVSHLVDLSNVRDGDEEFSSSFLASSIGGRAGNVIEMEFDAVKAEAAKSGPVADRFKLLLAIGQYTNTGISLIREGAQTAVEGTTGIPKDELAAAADAIVAAVNTLQAAHGADAVASPLGTVFTPHAAMWDTMGIPHVAVDPCQWSDAMAFFKDVAADARLVVDEWFPLRHDLMAVLDAVKAYAFRTPAPTLLARATASAFAIHNHHAFGGEPLLVSVVNMLANRFGANWYGCFIRTDNAEAEKAIADSIVDFANKTAPAGRAPPSPEETRRFMNVGTSTMLMETGRIIATLIVAYLRNQGRCHRVLVNTLPTMAQCQQQIMQIERRAFSHHGLCPFSQANPQSTALPRNEVLLALISDLMLDTCTSICLLTQRLGLLTTPELPAVLFYYQHMATSRTEALTIMHASETVVKEFKEMAKRRGAPPVLSLRKATPMPIAAAIRNEMTVIFTRALSWSFAVLKDKVPALQMPKKSLQTVGQIFDYRFAPLQQNLARPPLMTYRDIQENTKLPDAAKAIAQAVEQFKAIVQRVGAVRAQVTDAHELAFLDALEKASKKNAVTAGLVAKVPGYAIELAQDEQFPFVVTLNAVKLPASE